METTLKIIIGLHAASGFVALLTGFIAILAKKGAKIHRASGKVFFYAMLFVSATAIFVSVFKQNEFLLLIGIFALYQNLSGYRAIKNKSRKAAAVDWAIVAMGGLNGVFMLASGNIVLMVFGGISVLLAVGDVVIYARMLQQKPISPKEWLRQHIGMMMGTYIATSTAFIVVNVTYVQPAWLPWLLPTFIGVPFLVYMSRKYAPKSVSKS